MVKRDNQYKFFGSKRWQNSGGMPRSNSEAKKLADELSNLKSVRKANKILKTPIPELHASVVPSKAQPGKFVVYIRAVKRKFKGKPKGRGRR